MSLNTFNQSNGEPSSAQQLYTAFPRRYPPTSGGLPPAHQVAVVFPRKSQDAGSGPPPDLQLPEPSTPLPELRYEQKPFTDHTGNDGLSIFRGRVKPGQTPLLPPWSWQIYITYGATASTAGSVPLALYTSLIEQLSSETAQWFRFDVVFLPGADNVACIRHYRAEKRGRAGGERAMVPSYAGYKSSWQARNVMVVVDREDWAREGVRWVEFDGSEEEEGKEEVPEGFRRMMDRCRVVESQMGGPGAGAWVGERMDQCYRQSTMREGWEREYLLAKELMEA
ncbi:hypothetical protein MMC30_007987 [Trapelia coarctata]|nr:hypothetical protein [Trapelia coarctata]